MRAGFKWRPAPKSLKLMQLTPEDLIEFKEIYFEDFGIQLTDLEATDLANRLINVVECIAMPQSMVKQKDTVDQINKLEQL